MVKTHVLAVGLALLAPAACSEPLVFPDWTLPVEEGTAVFEYRHVPEEERDATIEWVEELVIGKRGDSDMRYAFTSPRAVTVDARGQIYVVDSRAPAIKVFDQTGEFLRELGREGQGPGEFQDPRSVVALPDRVIVGMSRNARWSHFDLDGNYIDDFAYPIYDNLELVRALPDGTIVGSTVTFDGPNTVIQGYGIYSPEAALLQEIVEVRYEQVPTIERNGRMSYFSAMPRARSYAVAAPDGGAYWTTSKQYQVMALQPDGAQRWALRVAMTPPTLTREDVDRVMEAVRGAYEDVTEAEVNFPEMQPALGGMVVDGHGHLYVYPYVPGGLSLLSGTPRTAPVDVYAPDGERLFSGLIEARAWMHADGDYVWQIGPDPDTEEFVVRKLRIVEPF